MQAHALSNTLIGQRFPTSEPECAPRLLMHYTTRAMNRKRCDIFSRRKRYCATMIQIIRTSILYQVLDILTYSFDRRSALHGCVLLIPSKRFRTDLIYWPLVTTLPAK